MHFIRYFKGLFDQKSSKLADMIIIYPKRNNANKILRGLPPLSIKYRGREVELAKPSGNPARLWKFPYR
jgi:hypothetical protein